MLVVKAIGHKIQPQYKKRSISFNFFFVLRPLAGEMSPHREGLNMKPAMCVCVCTVCPSPVINMSVTHMS